MSRSLTLNLPDEMARQAGERAVAMHQPIEAAVVALLRGALAAPPVEGLDDASILGLVDGMLPIEKQTVLGELLERQRESSLSVADEARLEALLADYRHGLVLKARAMGEAVRRGLRPPLDSEAA